MNNEPIHHISASVLQRSMAALESVIAVADRKTVEFDAARDALTDLRTVRAQAKATPIAWAVFAPNGNIRMWSTNSKEVSEFAERAGLPLTSLCKLPQQP